MPENNGEAGVLGPTGQGPEMRAFKPLGERGPTVYRETNGIPPEAIAALSKMVYQRAESAIEGIAPEYVAKLSRMSFAAGSNDAGCCAEPSSAPERSLSAARQPENHSDSPTLVSKVDRVRIQREAFVTEGQESLQPEVAYLQSLDPQAPMGAQLSSDAGCCCCAADLDLAPFTWLEKVEPNSFRERREIASKFDDNTECGHFFIVTASMDYQGQRPLLQSSDCQLRWWERTTVNTGPQSKFYPANTWYEVTLPGVTSSLGWEKRNHPGYKKCPGKVVIEISDRPALVKSIVKGVERTVNRTLDWYIVLSSAPTCRCRKRNVALRLMQRLVLKDGVVDWSQSGFFRVGKYINVSTATPVGA